MQGLSFNGLGLNIKTVFLLVSVFQKITRYTFNINIGSRSIITTLHFMPLILPPHTHTFTVRSPTSRLGNPTGNPTGYKLRPQQRPHNLLRHIPLHHHLPLHLLRRPSFRNSSSNNPPRPLNPNLLLPLHPLPRRLPLPLHLNFLRFKSPRADNY